MRLSDVFRTILKIINFRKIWTERGATERNLLIAQTVSQFISFKYFFSSIKYKFVVNKKGCEMAYINSYKNQNWLVPQSIKEMIPKEHICFFVEEFVESLDFSGFDFKLC